MEAKLLWGAGAVIHNYGSDTIGYSTGAEIQQWIFFSYIFSPFYVVSKPFGFESTEYCITIVLYFIRICGSPNTYCYNMLSLAAPALGSYRPNNGLRVQTDRAPPQHYDR